MGHITCLIVIAVVFTILSQEVSTESKHGSPATNQRLDQLRQRRLKFAERRKLKLQRVHNSETVEMWSNKGRYMILEYCL